MTAAHAPGLLALALNDGLPPGASPPFGRLLVLSVALHCGFFTLVANVQFSDTGPAPLAFQEVSLVALLEPNRPGSRPSKRVAKAEPVTSVIKDRPVPQKTNLSAVPSPPVTDVSPFVPAPKESSVSPPPPRAPEASPPKLIPMLPWLEGFAAEDRARSEALVREALSGIRLPPDHPARSQPSQAPGSGGTGPRPLADPAEPRPEPTALSPGLAPEAKAKSEALLREALARIQLPSRHPAGRRAREGSTRAETLVSPSADLGGPVPMPAPPSRDSAAKTDSRSEAVVRDALSKIELPPETPSFEHLSPLPTFTPTPTAPSARGPGRKVPSPAPALAKPADRSSTQEAQRQVASILGKLKVPDLPPGPPLPERTPRTIERKPQRSSSLAEDLGNKLRPIEDRQRATDVSKEQAARPSTATDAAKSQVARRTDPVGNRARLENPTMSILAPGAPSGSSRYWALVQHKISSYWVALAVEPTARSLVVVVKFRLHRSGKVSDVVVEEPSGNHYYDLAGKRAVVRAEPLPQFPSSIVKPYIDTHITFAVGEQSG